MTSHTPANENISIDFCTFFCCILGCSFPFWQLKKVERVVDRKGERRSGMDQEEEQKKRNIEKRGPVFFYFIVSTTF